MTCQVTPQPCDRAMRGPPSQACIARLGPGLIPTPTETGALFSPNRLLSSFPPDARGTCDQTQTEHGDLVKSSGPRSPLTEKDAPPAQVRNASSRGGFTTETRTAQAPGLILTTHHLWRKVQDAAVRAPSPGRPCSSRVPRQGSAEARPSPSATLRSVSVMFRERDPPWCHR